MVKPFGFGLKNGGGHGPIKVIGIHGREKVFFILTKLGAGYTSRRLQVELAISFFFTKRANGRTLEISDPIKLTNG